MSTLKKWHVEQYLRVLNRGRGIDPDAVTFRGPNGETRHTPGALVLQRPWPGGVRVAVVTNEAGGTAELVEWCTARSYPDLYRKLKYYEAGRLEAFEAAVSALRAAGVQPPMLDIVGDLYGRARHHGFVRWPNTPREGAE